MYTYNYTCVYMYIYIYIYIHVGFLISLALFQTGGAQLQHVGARELGFD